MSQPSPSNPPSGRGTLSEKTQIRLTVTNTIGAVALIGGAVGAYMKLPSKAEVREVATQAARELTIPSTAERAALGARVSGLERVVEKQTESYGKSLQEIRKELVEVRVLVGVNVAEKIEQSDSVRKKAQEIQKRVDQGKSVVDFEE